MSRSPPLLLTNPLSSFLLLLLLLLLASPCAHAVYQSIPTSPSSWYAVDNLNRTLPLLSSSSPSLSSPDATRHLGIFYFLDNTAGQPGPYDLTQLLAAVGGNREAAAYGPVYTNHHWGEPAFGYYLNDDTWVHAKHAQLLTDAGVDFVAFDVTNGPTWDSALFPLLATWSAMRSNGSRTPQVTFLCWNDVVDVTQHLHDVLYGPGLYSELWFQWEGKPLLMADPTQVNAPLLPLFTFRESWAWTQGDWWGNGQNRWPWTDWYPQGYGWNAAAGVKEQMPVAVGGWATANVGRSCQGGPSDQPAPALQDPSVGHYFRLMFSWALNRTCTDDSFVCSPPQEVAEVPQVIFVTGWNEWIAPRFVQGAECTAFLGVGCQPGDSYFVDEYTEEFSRDIEPMNGAHEDNYYYQLAAFARYFKGADQTPATSGLNTMAIDCAFTDWSAISAVYTDDAGDVITRSHPGFGNSNLYYTDNSGVDDLCQMRVAVDATHAYFYLSTCTGHWVNSGAALIYVGQVDGTSGWYGWSGLISVQQSAYYVHTGAWDSWTWQQAGTVSLCVGAAGQLELSVPLSLVGGAVSGGAEFVFKAWSGTAASPLGVSYPTDFMSTGDAAPNARFSYVYRNTGGGIAVSPNAQCDTSLVHHFPLQGTYTDALNTAVSASVQGSAACALFTPYVAASAATFSAFTQVCGPASSPVTLAVTTPVEAADMSQCVYVNVAQQAEIPPLFIFSCNGFADTGIDCLNVYYVQWTLGTELIGLLIARLNIEGNGNGALYLLPLGQWVHLCATYQASTQHLVTYVNGKVINDFTLPHSTASYGLPVLAGDGSDDSTAPTQGSFINWRVWSEFISQAEVQAVMVADAPGQPVQPCVA